MGKINKQIRIGVLLSGSGTNLQAIIDSCESGKIDGKIVFVGSDNPKAPGLERAKKHHIPWFVVDYTSIIRRFKTDKHASRLPDDFDMNDIIKKQTLFSDSAAPHRVRDFIVTRVIAEAALLEQIKSYPFDLLTLAGFMRNLTPYFVDKINAGFITPRIMNIHPALLPAFPGVDGYGDTFRYGCKIGGCTVHFIDYGEDSGPIIAQKAFEIREADTLETIKQKGLALEWEIYPQCINLFAQGRLRTVKMFHTLENGKTVQRRIVKITRPG